MCVAASPGQTIITATTPRVEVPSDHLLVKVLPLLRQVTKEFLEGFWVEGGCLSNACPSGPRRFLWDLNQGCRPASPSDVSPAAAGSSPRAGRDAAWRYRLEEWHGDQSAVEEGSQWGRESHPCIWFRSNSTGCGTGGSCGGSRSPPTP